MDGVIAQAAALLGLRRPEEALRLLDTAGSEVLEEPGFWQVRALAFRLLERPRNGLEACREGLSRAPWWAPLHDLQAALHLDLDELPEAEEAVLRALALDPEDPEPWCTYAHACALGGQLEKAAALLDAASARDPESVAVASARVTVAWLSGEDRATERASEALLALDPEHERGLTMLGLTRAMRGQTREGMAALSSAVMLNPRPDGPVQVAEGVRRQQHWSMWPQRLVARVGIGPLWIGVMVMLLGLVAAEAPEWAFLALGGAWVLLAAWSWVAPALLGRRGSGP